MMLDGEYIAAEHVADGAAVFAAAWCRGWTLPPPLDVSEWADAYRLISRKAGAEPGKWRTSRFPYLREILDCFSAHNDVREVDFMKSTQVGGTEVLNNVAGYVIDHAPAPMMVLMPTLGLSEKWSKQRFAPMIEEMECLRSKVAPSRSRDADNTTLLKGFPGGVVAITGANSTADLRSMPVKVLLADEVDEYEDNLDEQGDALELAERRLSTFSRRKIGRVSTPTVKDHSRIERGFNAGDQRRYHVPCPHCGQFQILEIEQLTDAGLFLCALCGALIEEHQKTEFLKERSPCTGCGKVPLRVVHEQIEKHLVFADVCACGAVIDPPPPDGAYWQPGKMPDDPRHRSYHQWAAYTPDGLGYTWREIADMRGKTKKDPDLEVTFVNTILGKTHDSATMSLESSEIKQRAEAGWKMRTLEHGVLLLTVGVDVQINRFHILIMGWGRGERGWFVDRVELPATPTNLKDYDQLDEFMEAGILNRYGIGMRPSMMAIDSGNWTHEVYAYVRGTRHPVMAIKGLKDATRPIINRPTPQDVRSNGRTIRHGVQLWGLGVNTAKTTMIGRLAADEDRDASERWFHIPSDMPEDFFQQITSEKYDARRGRWIKVPGRRNEDVDALTYAYAAALHPRIRMHKLRDPEWTRLESIYEPATVDLFQPGAQPATGEDSRETKSVEPGQAGPAPSPPPKRSGWGSTGSKSNHGNKRGWGGQ